MNLINDKSFYTAWLIIVLVFLIPLQDKAQEQVYTPQQCSNPVPELFRKSVLKKVQTDIREATDDSRKDKRTRQDFLLNQHFWFNNLVNQSLLLFNDSISDYISSVADHVLKDDPELRSQLQFVTIKSPVVNAFATDQGVILVTVGLLAQLEDESQLAYILCHEIVHYRKQHGFDIYKQEDNIDHDRIEYGRYNTRKKVLAKSAYSKDKELQADKEGLEMFLKTDYSTSTLNTVFDVLLYSDLPFDQIPFDLDFFEHDHYKIPDKAILKKINPIVSEEDIDDSFLNHPNVKTRRAEVMALLDGREKEKGVLYSDQQRFARIREICRYETSISYLQGGEFADALYDAFMMLKLHPNDRFLTDLSAAALYYIAIAKRNGMEEEVIPYYKDAQGTAQVLYYLLDKLGTRDAMVLANSYAWQSYIKHPTPLLDSLIRNETLFLINNYEMNLAGITHRDGHQVSAKDTMSSEDFLKLSKYEKIKLQKAGEFSDTATNYWEHAYDGLFDNPKFKATWLACESKAKAIEKKNSQDKADNPKPKPEHIDEIIAVNPFFWVFDKPVGQNDDVDIKLSSVRRHELINSIHSAKNRTGIKMHSLEVLNDSVIDASVFNDLALLNNWLSQLMLFNENLNDESLPFLTNKMFLDKIISKNNTPYCMWTGVVDQWVDRNFYIYFCLGIFTFPLTPFVIYAYLKHYQAETYVIIYNLETSETLPYTTSVKKKSVKKGIYNKSIYKKIFKKMSR